MLLAFSLLVSGVCVWASLRRLEFAIAPTAVDGGTLALAMRRDKLLRADVLDALDALPESAWERQLADALRSGARERAALVNEALSELDLLTQRWVRVPRVCASVASSSSFLLASLTLRDGLNAATVVADGAVGGDVNQAVFGAINVATVGIAGAVFCVAAQQRARKAAKERCAGADKLVEVLEASP